MFYIICICILAVLGIRYKEIIVSIIVRSIVMYSYAVKTIYKILKDRFLNTCYDIPNTSKYCVTYYRYGKQYKIILAADKILMKPKYFICDKSRDITSEVSPYIGPNHDFHNQTYTPADLDQNKLIIFRDVDGTGIHIEADQQIPTLLEVH